MTVTGMTVMVVLAFLVTRDAANVVLSLCLLLPMGPRGFSVRPSR
ncbi:hypothetical protein [Streptomyces pseudogriseolus]